MEPSRFLAPLSLAIVLSIAISPAQQWQLTGASPKGRGVTALAVKQSNGHLYATTGTFNWPTSDTGGVSRSTDGGNTWTRVFPANIARTVVVKSNGFIFASVRPTTNEGLFYSTNDGQSWTLTLDRGPNDNVFAVAFDTVSFLTPNVAYAGTRSGFGVHRNLAGGTAGSWLTSSQGLPLGTWILALAVAPLPPPALYGIALAGVMNPFNPATSGVYFSTNQGQGWSFATGIQQGDTVTSLIVAPDSSQSGNGRFVFAGTASGRIYRAYIASPAVSFSLVHSAAGEPYVGAFSAVNTSGLVRVSVALYDEGNGSEGILATTDRGLSWIPQNQGLPTARTMTAIASWSPGLAFYSWALRRYVDLRSEHAHPTAITSATPSEVSGADRNQNNGAEVYRRGVPTSVKLHPSEIPGHFGLHQNYPNPFNPSTTIQFALPKSGPVELRVYNTLGQEVATLVNEEKNAGTYSAQWNAGSVASGVYFYRLKAGEFTETKKLLLLR